MPCCAARAAMSCALMITRRSAYGKQGWDNPFFIAYAPGVILQK